MKEIKRIRKYLLDEKNAVSEELENYQKLEKEIQAKIDHSTRYIEKLMGSKSVDNNMFSPYGREKMEELEDEQEELESLKEQEKIVKFNLDKLSSKFKSLGDYLEDLDDLAKTDYFYIDEKKYDTVQDLLDEFQEDLDEALSAFEKRLKQFMFADPRRVQIEFQSCHKKIMELTEKIQECETILSDNRRGNR